MKQNLEITKAEISTSYINQEGNIDVHYNNHKFFLIDHFGKSVSRYYDGMYDLGNDHYAVSQITHELRYYSDYNYYDIIGNEVEIVNPKFKWGIIQIQRDKNGNIIPCAEKLVVNYLYDRISGNNLQTATAYVNDKLTYLDLNPDNPHYGSQLVPCILNHAVPFDTQYQGFAECSIDNVTGYLPRINRPIYSITSQNLLTENQVFYLSKYLQGELDICLGEETTKAYFHLTYETPWQSLQRVHKRILKLQRPKTTEE